MSNACCWLLPESHSTRLLEQALYLRAYQPVGRGAISQLRKRSGFELTDGVLLILLAEHAWEFLAALLILLVVFLLEDD